MIDDQATHTDNFALRADLSCSSTELGSGMFYGWSTFVDRKLSGHRAQNFPCSRPLCRNRSQTFPTTYCAFPPGTAATLDPRLPSVFFNNATHPPATASAREMGMQLPFGSRRPV